MAKIGLLVIATGKYDQFIPPLYKSMKKYFMKNHEVTMFVFTDKEMPKKEDLVSLEHNHEPWPNPTLKRYHIFDKYKDILSKMDYLYYCDADMLFVGEVGDEILPDTETGLVGTEHPGFYGGKRGTYDTNKDSTAFVPINGGFIYFAGGFNGGKSESFLKMSSIIKNNVDKDLSNNIIALWHDESHINRYFIDNKPKVLNPSYCYPESWNLPFDKKLLALDKNHNEIRK
jgi:histo-blood group ABO system transferase